MFLLGHDRGELSLGIAPSQSEMWQLREETLLVSACHIIVSLAASNRPQCQAPKSCCALPSRLLRFDPPHLLFARNTRRTLSRRGRGPSELAPEVKHRVSSHPSDAAFTQSVYRRLAKPKLSNLDPVNLCSRGKQLNGLSRLADRQWQRWLRVT